MNKHRRSELEAFDGCPHRFNVLYRICATCGQPKREHEPGGSGCETFVTTEDRGEESQRGVGFHEAAFRYIDRLAKANAETDADEASLALREGIALSQLPSKLAYQVGKLWRKFTSMFSLQLDEYFAAEQQQGAVFCLACDWRGTMAEDQEEAEHLTCPSCQGPVTGFTWIPDLVYLRPGEVEIKDWKTYYKGLTEAQARQEFQCRFYLWQARHLWPGFAAYRFTFVFVRLGYEVSVVMTPEEIDAFSDEVKGIALAMVEADRADRFPAIPGSHCGICRLQCPVTDNPYRLPARITSQEQRDQMALRILAMTSELRQLKKVLREHVKTEGGFEAGGVVFGLWPSVTRRYEAKKVLDYLEGRGIDISEITLSPTALGKLAKPKTANPAFLEFLAEIEQTKQGWKFTQKRIGDEAPEGLVDVLEDDMEDEEDDGDSES